MQESDVTSLPNAREASCSRKASRKLELDGS